MVRSWLHTLIFKVYSSLSDSMILWIYPPILWFLVFLRWWDDLWLLHFLYKKWPRNVLAEGVIASCQVENSRKGKAQGSCGFSHFGNSWNKQDTVLKSATVGMPSHATLSKSSPAIILQIQSHQRLPSSSPSTLLRLGWSAGDLIAGAHNLGNAGNSSTYLHYPTGRKAHVLCIENLSLKKHAWTKWFGICQI